jgi:hypothetical protein
MSHMNKEKQKIVKIKELSFFFNLKNFYYRFFKDIFFCRERDPRWWLG